MDLNARKEQICVAYFRAVVAAAGFTILSWETDFDRVDISVASDQDSGLSTRPRLDVQLKCTARDLLRADGLHLSLPRRDHADLASDRRHVPIILVGMVVPEDPAAWVYQHDRGMLVRRCAYWMSDSALALNTCSRGTTTVVDP